MEINGTWYAKDCIKVVEKVEHNSKTGQYRYFVTVFKGITYDILDLWFDTKELAEQSREKIIKQLEK